jgi:glycogen debranching enzyme
MTNEILLRVYPDLLFVNHGHTLLITDRRGNIESGLQGLYWHDLRLTSRHTLLINGEPPGLDSYSAVDHYSTLGYYFCAPRRDAEIEQDSLGLPKQELDRQVVVRVARFAGEGLHEDVEITNHGQSEAVLEIAWDVAADFADLIEMRGGERQQNAPIDTHWATASDSYGELHFHYRHPQLDRGAVYSFDGHGLTPRYEENRIIFSLKLGAQESRRFCMKVAPVKRGERHDPVFGCDAFEVASRKSKVSPGPTLDGTRVRTANPVVQLAWDRAVHDLAALALGDGETPAERTVTAAGLPLYGTLFGRDALTIAGQSLFLSPVLAEGTLRLLKKYIGTKDDDFYDEQPGRVPQQVRDNPMALLGMKPWLHDYGDYAAPCAYLVLLGGYHIVTGDKERTREFLEPARRVLDWLDTRADLDGDGFLDYKTRSPEGQRHQGWKDSGDAVRYEDGREVEPPVAPCEIQGYWYAGKLLMAEVFLAMGEPSNAFDQLRQAASLRRRFNDAFWMPDKRFIAYALDSEKRQVKSIVSNVGHCLATGIIEHKHAPDVVRRLMAPDMFSGWGIRTISAAHPAYNPIKYHLGSVWPVENATIAFGMKRYGFSKECNTLAKGMFDAAALFEHHRLPETFGGFQRDGSHPHPGLYPDACAPQGWSASAVVWFLQAMLGLWSYAPLGLLLVDPDLPPWLPELTVRDLRVGKGRVSIRFRRQRDGTTDYKVLERHGGLRVVRQPPPDEVGIGPFTRVREAAGSFLPWGQ